MFPNTIFTVDSKLNGWGAGYFHAASKYADRKLDILDEEDKHVIKTVACHLQNHIAYSTVGQSFTANRTFAYGYLSCLYELSDNMGRKNIVKFFNEKAAREHVFLTGVKIFNTPFIEANFDMFLETTTTFKSSEHANLE